MQRSLAWTLFFVLITLQNVVSVNNKEEEDDFYDDDFGKDKEEDSIVEEDVINEEGNAVPSDEFDTDIYDEFEEIIPASTPLSKNELPKVIEIEAVATKPFWVTWWLEIIYIVFVVLYAINFFIGKNTNENIATNWGKTYVDLFLEQFSSVGSNSMLVKQSQSTYYMRATGRINCLGLQAVLELNRRNDLLFAIYHYFTNNSDKLIFDIALPSSTEPVVFALIPSKREKDYKKSRKDVESFTKAYFKDNAPPNFSILAESEEVVSHMLNNQVLKVLCQYSSYLDTIQISDQKPNNNFTHTLRFVFKLPPIDKMEELRTLIKLVLFYIDHVASFKLSSPAKKKALDARFQANKITEEEKIEALNKAREEKLKKEKERYESLTPAQKAKEDEKRAKKEKKRAQNMKYKFVYG